MKIMIHNNVCTRVAVVVLKKMQRHGRSPELPSPYL